MLQIDITITGGDWPDAGFLEDFVQTTTAAVFERLGFLDLVSELSLVFSCDAEVRALNARWRGQDKATNVLSFPIQDVQVGERPGPILGDIIIAYETVEREALAEDKPLLNHVRHMLVHGVLHLLGYDHENEGEAEIMEQWEREILADLGVPNPYREYIC
ncbi:rRNA maturation RNase YbeY [Bartonella sp. DGB2]|uniref:rRNA maturation RNase YbeY n=1 Tax=Bartonella sp. DGB2 TaxID=3388426 RepID=UPI003990116C